MYLKHEIWLYEPDRAIWMTRQCSAHDLLIDGRCGGGGGGGGCDGDGVGI